MFADTAMMGLGFQIVATMFSITLTLQLILQEINVHEASTRRMYFYIFLAVCMLLQVLSLFFIFARDSNAREKRYQLQVAAYSMLTLIYFTVFLLLNQKMSRLDIEKLNSDKVSIKCQFGVFMFAFSTRTMYYIVQLIAKLKFSYATALLEAVFMIWWEIIPVAYMLSMHHRTYSKVILKQRINSAVAPPSEIPTVRSFVTTNQN